MFEPECQCSIGIFGDRDCPVHGNPDAAQCSCSPGLGGESQCPKHAPRPPKSPSTPDDLRNFDLVNNWGNVPMDVRVRLAKAELASGIPGLARAEGVRWWERERR